MNKRNCVFRSCFVKNILNLVFLILVWSVFYAAAACVQSLVQGNAIGVRSVLSDLVNGHYHMWYLYMLIGLYLATPFLRAFVKKENKHLVLLFLGLALCAQFTLPIIKLLTAKYPFFKECSDLIDKFELQFFSGYTAYYLAGWYTVHVGLPQKRLRIMLYATGGLSFVLSILLSLWSDDFDNAFNTRSFLMFFYAVSVFTFFSNLRLRLSEKRKHLLIRISGLTFGIYILHPFFQEILSKAFPYQRLPVLYTIAIFLVLSVLSAAVTWVISKIPFFKKVVRM